jgi:predicted DCC family thiol-disulfide oxidoreductase YuxK
MMDSNSKAEIPKVPTPLIIFDGVCAMCNRFVNLVLRRDKAALFFFASNASPVVQELLAREGQTEEACKSVLVFDGNRILNRSEAVLFIAQHLGFPYTLLALTRVVPRGIRDGVYSIVARLRLRIAGKVAECSLIPPEWRHRIL